MKVVVIIPARYGSSRLGGKPLKSIAGKAMIQRVYERARLAPKVAEVVVATDDARIYEAVEKFGGRVIMTSADHRSGTDRVAEASQKMGLGMNDIVVNVQGDQPLLDPRCLDQVIAPFYTDPLVKISTLAIKIVDPREISDPKDVKLVFDHQGWALYFSRSPIPHDRDGLGGFGTYKHLGIYAYTREFLEVFRKIPEGHLEKIEKLEQLRALESGHRIKVVVTTHDSPEVDLPSDIQRIEKQIELTSGQSQREG